MQVLFAFIFSRWFVVMYMCLVVCHFDVMCLEAQEGTAEKAQVYKSPESAGSGDGDERFGLGRDTSSLQNTTLGKRVVKTPGRYQVRSFLFQLPSFKSTYLLHDGMVPVVWCVIAHEWSFV